MRSKYALWLGLAVSSALALGDLGCADDIHVEKRQLLEAPHTGTLVESTWNTPRGTPSAAPTAYGGGPLIVDPNPSAENPPTGANDEGTATILEASPGTSTVAPDASEQSGGITQPSGVQP